MRRRNRIIKLIAFLLFPLILFGQPNPFNITKMLQPCTHNGAPVQLGGIPVVGCAVYTDLTGRQYYCSDTMFLNVTEDTIFRLVIKKEYPFDTLLTQFMDVSGIGEDNIYTTDGTIIDATRTVTMQDQLLFTDGSNDFFLLDPDNHEYTFSAFTGGSNDDIDVFITAGSGYSYLTINGEDGAAVHMKDLTGPTWSIRANDDGAGLNNKFSIGTSGNQITINASTHFVGIGSTDQNALYDLQSPNIGVEDDLILINPPTLNNTATDILVRNSGTGVVEYRDVSTLSSGDLLGTAFNNYEIIFGDGTTTGQSSGEFIYSPVDDIFIMGNIFHGWYVDYSGDALLSIQSLSTGLSAKLFISSDADAIITLQGDVGATDETKINFNRNSDIWELGQINNSNDFRIAGNSLDAMVINYSDKQITIPGYDAGIFDGTPDRLLGINASEEIITLATIPDSYITESSVTQHETALTITESQISDLSHTDDLNFAEDNLSATDNRTHDFNSYSATITELNNFGISNGISGSVFRFYEGTTTGTNYVGLRAPVSVGSDITFTLPSAHGGAGYILQNDGAGILSFVPPPSDLHIGNSNLTTTDITRFLSLDFQFIIDDDSNPNAYYQINPGAGTYLMSTDNPGGLSYEMLGETGGAIFNITSDDGANENPVINFNRDGGAGDLSTERYNIIQDNSNNLVIRRIPIASSTATDLISFHSDLSTHFWGQIYLEAVPPTDNTETLLLVRDAGTGQIELRDVSTISGGSGEINTYSNAGVGGVGITLTKVGVDFPFKSINEGSSKISITNDAGNNEIDIDVNEAALTITESQISDLQPYLLSEVDGDITNEGDLTVLAGTGTTSLIHSNTSGSTDITIEVSAGIGISEAANTITLTNTGVITEINDLSSAVTWATVPDAFISESSVTQHEAALTITESQISDLAHYTHPTYTVDRMLFTDASTGLPTVNGTWGASGMFLYNNTTKYIVFVDDNIALGNSAGNNLSAGFSVGNTFFGDFAGNGTGFTATSNTMVGDHAGASITGSANNTFVGSYAGEGANGAYSVAVGSVAGFTSIGSRNTLIGYYAGGLLNNPVSSSVAGNNALVGYYAGASYTDGAFNAIVGAYHNPTTNGDNYTGIGGYTSLDAVPGGDGRIVIGYRAGMNVTGANQFVIANDATDKFITGDMSTDNLFLHSDVVIRDIENVASPDSVLVITPGSREIGKYAITDISGGGGGTDFNFAEDNLTADADRTHDFTGFDLNINDIVDLNLNATNLIDINTSINDFLNITTTNTVLGATDDIVLQWGDQFRLASLPPTDNSNTLLLTRDATTGEVELRDVSTITGSGDGNGWYDASDNLFADVVATTTGDGATIAVTVGDAFQIDYNVGAGAQELLINASITQVYSDAGNVLIYAPAGDVTLQSGASGTDDVIINSPAGNINLSSYAADVVIESSTTSGTGDIYLTAQGASNSDIFIESVNDDVVINASDVISLDAVGAVQIDNDNLYFLTALTANPTETVLLVRNSSTGKIEYRDVSTLPASDKLGTSFTANEILVGDGTSDGTSYTNFNYNGTNFQVGTSGATLSLATFASSDAATTIINLYNDNFAAQKVTFDIANIINGWSISTESTGDFSIADGANSPFQIEASSINNALYIDNAGLIGIGTSSPNENLTIDAGASAATVRLSGTNSIFRIASDTEVRRIIGTNAAGTTAVSQLNYGTNAISFYGATGSINPMNIHVAGTYAGNVGIGTNTPAYPLHILNNGSAILIQESTSGSAGVRYKNSVSEWNTQNNSSGSFLLRDVTNSKNILIIEQNAPQNSFYIASSGNVGIGTSSFGTSAVGVLAIANGTEPTTSPANIVQLWAENLSSNNAQLFFRGESSVPEMLTKKTVSMNGPLVKTSSTSFSSTGLARELLSNRRYRFEAILYTTSGSSGGVKAQVTCTCSGSVVYEGYTMDNNNIYGQTRASSFSTTVGAVTAVTNATIHINGTISTSSAGNFFINFAQNASSGTSSTVNTFSTMVVQPVTNVFP